MKRTRRITAVVPSTGAPFLRRVVSLPEKFDPTRYPFNSQALSPGIDVVFRSNVILCMCAEQQPCQSVRLKTGIRHCEGGVWGASARGSGLQLSVLADRAPQRALVGRAHVERLTRGSLDGH